MAFIKRSQQNDFHNLQHLENSSENDIEEEEYQWIKKRNAKLLKDQQEKLRLEAESKNNDKENVLSSPVEKVKNLVENPSENDLDKQQDQLITPQKIKKEEKKSTRILTPIQNNSNRTIGHRNTVKGSFKSPSKTSESFPSDDMVKILSPVIERATSKLSIHSFSDSKETTPVREEKQEKYLPEEPREELPQTPKPSRERKPFQDESKEDASYDEEDVSPAVDIESKYDLEDSVVEQLFSKVRHNRIKQVTTTLEEGFDVQSMDRHGNNLLHICAQNNLSSMASLCLTHGADINAMNKKGLTPLDYCDMYHFSKLGEWFVMMGGENSSYGNTGKE